jgi:hypothetical protein
MSVSIRKGQLCFYTNDIQIFLYNACYGVFHNSIAPPEFSGNHGNHKNWVPSMLPHWFVINLDRNEAKKKKNQKKIS